MGHQNVIELNGKRYDALTGALLGDSSTPVAVPLARVGAKGKTIDGFIRSSKAKTHVAVPVKKPVAAVKTVKAPESPIVKATKPTHPVAEHAKAHRPEHAKTLMRHVVAKPKTSMKKAVKVQTSAEVAARQVRTLTAKHSAYQVDARRLAHARQVSRHVAIAHFHAGPAVMAAVAPIPAQVSEPALHNHHPVPIAPTHTTAHHPHHDIFEAAIAKANSHQQPKHHDHKRAKRRRVTNIVAGAGAFLVIAGFIGYLNMPNIELRVASFQAGFGAQMPGYTPTGFALRDGVQRAGNTVSMKYQSGDQTFTVTQQPSDWNSQTLVENTLALNGSHKTLYVDGRTVYIYGGSNAVWVDGNVRYDVIGNAALSESDITALASSL